MRLNLIVLFCLLSCFGCSTVESTTNYKSTQRNNTSNPRPTPPLEENRELKPIKTEVRINEKQQKYLDESVPPEVRKILEKAEKFEVLAELKNESDGISEGQAFEPNRIVRVTDEEIKKQVLESFYIDAAKEDSPASCYIPHHAIRANYQKKDVEIEICFSCSRFIVRGDLGEFSGTIVRENRKSEDYFTNLLKRKGTELTK